MYLTNPHEEMMSFPDLWLNHRMYQTSIVLQFQLPRPVLDERVLPPPSQPIVRREPCLLFPLTLIDSDDSEAVTECGICYESIPYQDHVTFDCGHAYCVNCSVKVYKTHHQACAMCRKPTGQLLFQKEEQRKLCKSAILECGDRVSEVTIVN